MSVPNPPFLTVDSGSGLPYLGAGALGGVLAAPVGQTLTPTAGFPGAGGLNSLTTTFFGFTASQSGSFAITNPPAGLNTATLTLPLPRIGLSPNFTKASQATGSFAITGNLGGGPVYGTITAMPGAPTVLLSAAVPPGLALVAPVTISYAMTYSCWPL